MARFTLKSASTSIALSIALVAPVLSGSPAVYAAQSAQPCSGVSNNVSGVFV